MTGIDVSASSIAFAEGLKRKIFFDNPQRFYGMTVDPAAFGAGH